MDARSKLSALLFECAPLDDEVSGFFRQVEVGTMLPFAEAVTQHWKASRRFRIGLIAAVCYFLLRLALSYGWQMGWLSMEDSTLHTDLQLYWETGEKFRAHEDLYFAPQEDFSVFVYAPPFALLMSPLSYIPFSVLSTLYILLIIAAYAAIYWRWYGIFKRYGLESAAQQMIYLLPLWVVAQSIIYDINYLNVYTVMALLATLLIEAVLAENLSGALLCLVVILPIKPQWAFALALPFLLRHWRFGFKLLIGSVLVYAAVMGFTLLVGGPPYVLEQYGDYIHTVRSIPETFFWNQWEDAYIGYVHSLMQVMLFFFGESSSTLAAVTVVKVLLWLPLLWAAWLMLRRRASPPPAAELVEWVLVLYVGTFLLLDVMHEMTLGVVVYIVLLVTIQRRTIRRIMKWAILPCLLGDILSILTFALYLPDPMNVVPLVLIALLAAHTILVGRLLGIGWFTRSLAREADS
jgi:hypothetical protein